MKFAIDDAVYWYEIEGEGEPIVLLHGFTGSTSTWSHFIKVNRKTYQLITIDLPGHGKTTMKKPRTMEQCCMDLQRLLLHLSLPSFHLVGYSMGGRTALAFSLHCADMVKSLTLESASPGLKTLDEREKRIKQDEKLARKLEREGLDSFIDYWETIPLFTSQQRLPNAVKQAIRNERLAQSEQGLAASLRFMGTGKQSSYWHKLHLFQRPVLLLVGEKDSKFIRINEEMNELFPNSELTVVKEVGHAIHVEQPAIFGKLVMEFIQTQTT